MAKIEIPYHVRLPIITGRLVYVRFHLVKQFPVPRVGRSERESGKTMNESVVLLHGICK
jgi:hypothetical protein